jgi:ribosomal protein L15
VKLLGHGEIQVPLFIKVNKCSQGARQKIEAAGGTVEEM